MKRKARKLKLVAFKVDAKLAAILNALPDKSDFIRKAIAAQMGTTCPLCRGKGIVPRGIHDHFEPLVRTHRHRPCTTCGNEQTLPEESADLEPEDRERLEQFFMGGPLYCEECYPTIPLCSECGWHVDAEHLNDHVRSRHAEKGNKGT